MESITRALWIACCFFIVTATAESASDRVKMDAGASSGTRLAAGVKYRAGGGQGGTPMHWMAFSGNEAGIRQLIISGAEIDARVRSGSTPLHLAAYKGHTAVVRLLIEHGAKVNARTKTGITPLDWARRNGHEETVALLIAQGARTGKVLPPKPEFAAAVTMQPAATGSPGPVLVRRRRAPLKYGLLGVPESISVELETVEINADTQGRRPAQAKPTARPKATAAARPKPTARPEAKTNDGYRIQLGAFSSEQRARAAWALYARKYPGILGPRELIVESVAVKQKNFHRVQAGPMSRSDAGRACDRLRQAGQACVVVRRTSS